MGLWVRRRAGDTHAASQVTSFSKACPNTGELGPAEAGGDGAQGTLGLGTELGRWDWAGAGFCGEAFHLLAPLHPKGTGLRKTVFGEKS